jgi:UDP-3-O-[3-hydroxymyristoyl] glucosamine N-acyltransferase
MIVTAKELSELLNGEIVGDPAVVVHSPSKIEEGKKGTISFLANPKYEHFAYTTEASILLVGRNFVPSKTLNSTLIKVDDVYASIGNLLNKFGDSAQNEYEHSSLAFIHDETHIHENTAINAFACIAEGVEIGEGTVIHSHVTFDKNVKVGKNCIIYPGVKVYANTVIGDHVIVHAGAVIGCDGFGYSKDDEGKYTKLNHVGNVIIEDHVEIGANATIDRATMGSTVIKQGAKLDNLTQIAHNVEIGEHTVMAALSGIAGSTKIGKHVTMGGQVGVIGHRTIADGVMIQGKSGVISNVREKGKRLYGYPAIEYGEYLKAYALMRQLPKMKARIEELEKKLSDLSKE